MEPNRSIEGAVQETGLTRRRGLIAVVGGIVGALVARGAQAPIAEAANGDPILAGQTTSATATTTLSAATAGPGFYTTNTSGGPGIEGQSTSGVGIFGASASNYAVWGSNSSSTGAGAGVVGQGSSSAGVIGQSTTNYGVYGYSQSSFGIVGQTSNTVAVYGQATGNYGLYGTSSTASAVVGSSTSGAGVSGQSSSNYGVYGSSSSSNGVVGSGTSGIGVVGQSGSSYGGYFSTQAASAWAAYVNNTQAAAQPGSALGLYVNGNLVVANGTKSAAVDTSQGLRLVYCTESPLSMFEDFGTGHLVNGSARVALDPLFAETIEGSGLQVFLTPRSGSSKGLAVEQQDATGFTVVELGNGKGSYAFDYRVVARRKGTTDAQRLAPVEHPHASGASNGHFAAPPMEQVPAIEKPGKGH